MHKLEEIRAYFGADNYASEQGIVIDDVFDGGAQCSVVLEKRHMNSQNIAQGGLIFTLADFAFGVAANTAQKGAVTLNASIQYMQPGVGNKLIAVAKQLHKGKKTGVYEVLVKNDAGVSIALFTATGYFKSQFMDKSNNPE